MFANLDEPSLGALRARLIQEHLAGPGGRAGSDPGGEGRSLPRLAATGKTGSGKSTLGNLLVGMAGLLRSTGYQDCTDSADVIRFPRGLSYLDLPGVAGDEAFENCNRAALGLPQRSDLEQVREVRVREFDPTGPADLSGPGGSSGAADGHRWPLDRLPTALPRPDLVLYVVAPHQNLNRDELPYLADLLAVYGAERILFVFNVFHRADGGRKASKQNLEDVRNRLDRVCRAAGAALSEDRLIELDCRTGEGLDRLLAAAHRIVGDDGLLAEVVARQQQDAPDLFRAEVGRAVTAYAAQAAALTPGPDGAVPEELEAAAVRLLDYAVRLGAAPPPRGEEQWRASFRAIAATAAAKLRHEATEPVVERRSERINRTETVYEWIEETDYSQPLYETRRYKVDVPVQGVGLMIAVALWLSGARPTTERWESEQVHVGYGTVRRQVPAGTREVYDHTEHWDEVVGTRVTAVYYTPYGPAGPRLLHAAWAAALRGEEPSAGRRRADPVVPIPVSAL